ncbi:hypothetical protein [Candidatus Halocynthiibacter alkanivorans]|uniref:hypothetical protein n=1 Tax=Candidatus Halocynthiibacter alkanivorans TaxID=2267619 RepID=UPI00109BFB63|nr:hypothetical protein [Candidatus Halocynthiibacter alkanivorans]
MYIDKPVVCGILPTLKVRLESVCYRALFRPLIPETYGRALQIARPLLNSNPRQVLVGFWRGTVARSKGPHRAVDCGWCGHNRLFHLCFSRGAYFLLLLTMRHQFPDRFTPFAFGSWQGKEFLSDMIGKVFPTQLWLTAQWIWRWASLVSVFGGLTLALETVRPPDRSNINNRPGSVNEAQAAPNAVNT